MQQLSIASIILVLSSAYTIFLLHIATSAYVLQKALAFPVIILFLSFYFSSSSSWKKILTTNGKWLLLFVCTTVIQLLILSTGGLKSPFLILIHLLMVGLSFLFSFFIGL